MTLALGGLALHVFAVCILLNLVFLLFIITKNKKRIVTNDEKIQSKRHN